MPLMRIPVIAVVAVLCTPLQPHLATAEQRTPRASASVLSEHHIEALKSMTPQQQAELLLERAINHYRGANEQITARAPGWLGHIKLTPSLESLFRMAINSDDMRVRTAAIEMNVSARDLSRDPATIDRLEPDARSAPGRARMPCGTSPARQSRRPARAASRSSEAVCTTPTRTSATGRLRVSRSSEPTR